MTFQQQCELLTTIRRLFDGSLDARQTEEFGTLLANDVTARQLYIDFVALTVDLDWACGHQTGNTAAAGAMDSQDVPAHTIAPPSPEMGQKSLLGFLSTAVPLAGGWLSSPKVLAASVAGGLLTYFAVLGISVVLTRGFVDNRDASKLAASPGEAPARIVFASDLRWQDSSVANQGTKLVAGTSRLAEGVVEIEFDGGARVRIQGPAEFAPQSGQRMELTHGRVIAYVPKRARGFVIATPTAEVVDLGTEFGLEVGNNGDTEVQVIRGQVSVTTIVAQDGPRATRAAVSPIPVRAGQALNVSRTVSGDVVTEPVPFDAQRVDQLARSGDLTAIRRPSTTLACWASPDGLAGNQFDFRGGLGFDFKVMRPIRIYRLGVFDHLGDGIDPNSPMTVQLWSRDSRQTDDTQDDAGRRVLAEATISSEVPGQLRYCHRFVALTRPVDLPPGDYSLVAYGFSNANGLVNFSMQADKAHLGLSTFHNAIVSVGSRYDDKILSGTFPAKVKVDQMIFIACSFEFAPQDNN